MVYITFVFYKFIKWKWGGGRNIKMTDSRIGQKARFILVGDRHYSGKIISEDEFFITILDKFQQQVSFGKNAIISMEVLI